MAPNLSHPNSPYTVSASNSSSPSLYRKPTKKSSFLSLKKEKKASASPSTSVSLEHSRSGIYSTSPSSFQHFDFDDLLEPKTSGPYPPRHHEQPPPPRTSSLRRDSSSRKATREKREYVESSAQVNEQCFEFPSVEEDASFTEDVKAPWPRMRSQTGPSGRHDSDHAPFLNRSLKYPFRDSGSSSLSQFDPLPQTPIDDMSFRGSVFHIPVMVAAPISGVETMDALVDGMNGVGADDHFMGSGGISGRSKVSKTGYHPLYHPPLPTPPPGVVLGKAPRKARKPHESSSDDDSIHPMSRRSQRPKNHRPASSRDASNITVTKSSLRPTSSREDISLYSNNSSSISDESLRPTPPPQPQPTPSPSRTVAPSISEIIRTHAPATKQALSKTSLSRSSSRAHSNGHGSLPPEKPIHLSPDPLPSTDDDTDFISRSSVDTIAEEVRQTIRNQARVSVMYSSAAPSPSYLQKKPSTGIYDDVGSPVSDNRRESSIYSYSTSTISDQPPLPPLDLSTLTKTTSPSQAIAQYLRSSRLTTTLKLTRSPHASRGVPLTVSFSDLGSPTGSPLVVFLGLGCVRQIMGLYDEMAECLGIRLITIDRWGLGLTDSPRTKSARGIPEWAGVVEEVLDRLNIDQCSVMAHSAGAPYALAFANKFPERIRGDICLLAPWVGGGEGAGYKWLKYVPNGILKTAQAAEWKVQTWMLGKPPTIAYAGIGFDVKTSRPGTANSITPTGKSYSSPSSIDLQLPQPEAEGRRSMSSGIFSDYDDLRDFEGRFDSRSTLGRRSEGSTRSRTVSESRRAQATPRKPSKGFLGRLKGATSPQTQSPKEERSPNTMGSGNRLKALRSMGSLKGKSSSQSSSSKKSPTPPPILPPTLPSPFSAEIGLGLGDDDWTSTLRAKSYSTPPTKVKAGSISSVPFSDTSSNYRSGGRRSMSFGPSKSPPIPPPPVPPLPASPMSDATQTPSASYQAQLGNALIAASHAESAKGTHADLVQILNHDRQPWGFSYSAYPHQVRVWYGDRDDRIAENVVRWMENTMGPDKCSVKVIKGASHALMFKSSVVIEVMEYFSDCWRLN
ncbi:hypothetical protein QCA50_001674 [Cerrena zonata]|uniref:AB hydrolase-1 domain-containing protein n=1 Tax=Cerrena zonata TaxID=2478898 RepID=A0AAW0GVH6_9APHY